MRVLHVYFASPGTTPKEAGGIAGYAARLARFQRDLGLSVAFLSSGQSFTPSSPGSPRAPFWRRLQPVEGFERYEIVDAPFLTPALWNFARAQREAASPDLDRCAEQVARAARADVVHIHSLEGLSASCVAAFQRGGARVMVSLHNHFAFCPQVYLMRGRRTPCLDHEGGTRCATCETPIDVEAEMDRRALGRTADPPSIPAPPMPPVLRFLDSGAYAPETEAILSAGHPLWTPLENVPPDAERARASRHPMGERRRAMVGALACADRVHAVSRFVSDLAISMGVPGSRIATHPIAAEPGPKLTHRNRSDGLLRLVFLGFNNYYKGLHMLVDAIALLPAGLRSRVHLAAFGPGCQSIRERAGAIRPRLAGLEVAGAYEPARIPELLAGRDIGVVPSVWWDNGPQTLIEMLGAGLPVLAAKVGGIPDRVRHEQNGMLFRGNDRPDAARQIERLITEPGLVERLWRGVTPLESPEDHARAVVDLYAQTLQSPEASAPGEER